MDSCQRCSSVSIASISIKLRDNEIYVDIPCSNFEQLPSGLSFLQNGSYFRQRICTDCGQLQGRTFPIYSEELTEDLPDKFSTSDDSSEESIRDHRINVTPYNNSLGLYRENKYGFIIGLDSSKVPTIIGLDQNGKIIDIPQDKELYLEHLKLSINDNFKELKDMHNKDF